MYDLVIKNANIVTFDSSDNIVNLGYIVIDKGIIIDVLTQNAALPQARQTLDQKGKLVTPGLIDCHTHVIYGGNRADEFEMRLQGVSYEEIAKKGGGIRSSVKATRQASKNSLYESAYKRVLTMMNYGATTCEIKSGYGLDFDNEFKMLEVAKMLNEKMDIDIISTFLAAHALPPEYQDKDAYIDMIIDKMLPVLNKNKLSNFIDGFCEGIAFTPKQIKRLFHASKSYGFNLKLHAEQLSDSNGAAMAAQLGAKSVDHLEYLDEADIPVLRENNTVAVVLPGAFYFLKEQKKPPIQALVDQGVEIAIATDANPGSSPFLSLPLMMNMACTLFAMTPYNAFKGVTINAAKALDIDKHKGSVEQGKCADLILWDCHHYNHIIYDATYNYRVKTIKTGRELKA